MFSYSYLICLLVLHDIFLLVTGMQSRCGSLFSLLASASCPVGAMDSNLNGAASDEELGTEADDNNGFGHTLRGARSREQLAAALRHSLRKPRQRIRKLKRLLGHTRKLHASHALSMDVLVGRGLEMSSHSADCWPHVFRLELTFIVLHDPVINLC